MPEATPDEAQTKKAAMGAEAHLPWESHPDVCVLLQKLQAEGTPPNGTNRDG